MMDIETECFKVQRDFLKTGKVLDDDVASVMPSGSDQLARASSPKSPVLRQRRLLELYGSVALDLGESAADEVACSKG